MPVERNPLSISLETRDGVTVVAGHGYVDLSTRLKLSTALNELVAEGRDDVVVDLCEVEFIDSTGLGVLMNALRRLTRQRRTLRVACAPGPVRRVFELAGLEGTFAIFDSREDACASLGRPG